MDLLEFSIFKEEQMKSEVLKENQEAYYYIYGRFRKEIIEISKGFSKEDLEKFFINNQSTEGIKEIYENLLYLLDGVKMIEGEVSEEKGREDEESYTIADIGELTIKDILSFNFKIESNNLNINLNEVYAAINQKRENDIWNENVVEETIAEKYLIEDKSKVKLINSLSDYTQFIYELESKSSNSYVSRGQKDCSFDLTPSIYRIHKKKQDVHAKGYEHTFRQKMAYYQKDTRERSLEELRAEGQHYGLPTEYLDFTEAHIISLLFAIEDYTYTKNHSIVYFVDSTGFNKESVNKEEKLINLQFENEKIYLNDYSSCSYFMKVPNINERIHYQKGCFLRLSQQDYQDNKDFLDNLKNKCGIAIINKQYKEEILKELFSLGINFESIYPDKDNLVKSIRFNYEVILGGGKTK